MAAKIAHLCGVFKKSGPFLSDEKRTFVLVNRTNPKKNQPLQYIVQKDKNNPNGIHISGVFWTSSTTARIDFKGIDYEMTFTADEVTIKIA